MNVCTISTKNYVLCVDGVYVKGSKILLLKRNVEPFKNCWGLVGGHVDDGETVKEALKREFLEEIGLAVDIGELIDGRLEETPDRIKIILTFLVTSAKGEIKLNNENREYGWFSKIPNSCVYDYNLFLQKVTRTQM